MSSRLTKYQSWLLWSAIIGGIAGGIIWLILVAPNTVRPLTTYQGAHPGEEAAVNRYIAPFFAFIGSAMGVVVGIVLCLIVVAIHSLLTRR